MSENKDNKLTLINEKTANDYLTHTFLIKLLRNAAKCGILINASDRDADKIS